MSGECLTTRERILHLLRRNGPLTAQELSGMLDISVSAVRQHTSVLQRASLVASRVRRRKVGRPGHEFVLSPESEDAFPKVYKEIAMSLLEAAQDLGGEELVRKLLSFRRDHIQSEYTKVLGHLSPEEMFPRIAEKQNERGYLAHLERTDGVMSLIQHNCPIQELSEKYPECCESERKMYEDLLGRGVRLEHCRAEGAQCCCFTAQKD